MPEGLSFEALRGKGIEQVEALVVGEWGGERLSTYPEELQRRFSVCWRLVVSFSDGQRQLLLLLDMDFPFSLPRVALEDGPDLLSWPHLEREGLLCVLPGIANGDYLKPASVTHSVVADACRLIESNISGGLAQDFRDEFLSYWSYDSEDGARRCISLVTPAPPSREIAVWRSKRALYFGDSESELQTWLSRRFGRSPDKFNTTVGWLIWRDAPLTPDEYPRTGRHLRQALQSSTDDLSAFDSVLQRNSTVFLLVGARGRFGACFGGVVYTIPTRTRSWKGGRGPDPITKGFRPGRVPPQVRLARTFGCESGVSRRIVDRADPAWIHGRDHDARHERLRTKHVCLIGIGSLGSAVAVLLVQSGIGKLTLIDPDRLEWSNIGRHALGAQAVGENKAVAMANHLEGRFPHVDVSGIDKAIGLADLDLLSNAFTSDLVVLATGSWSSEAIVNRAWVRKDEVPAVNMIWMEDHALASHSVLLKKGDGNACLQCGLDNKGKPRLTATEWPSESVLQIPACGGMFMPYGPTEVSAASSLAAEHSIQTLCGSDSEPHWVWLASEERVREMGGKWSEAWTREIGDPGSGARRVESSWPRNPDCPACG